MGMVGRDPVDGYVWLSDPSLNLGSSGPSRVKETDAEPPPALPPLGFVTRDQWDAAQPEPLLWEGD